MTPVAAAIVTVQEPFPLHGPLHPANSLPLAALAVKVTCVPELYDWEQVAPQFMPVGLEVTVPEPVPFLLTVSG